MALGIDATCRDNEMDVGMQPQLAAPGVKNAVKADFGPQAFGILPEGQQGLGGVFEQEVVHDSSVEPAQGIEDIRQSENAVVIGYRK